jgi:chromosome segregation ATPase
MEPFLQELVKLIPVFLTGLIPTIIAYISLNNRQRAAKIEAQDIIFREYQTRQDENGRILKLLEDEKAARKQSQQEYETERDRLNALITDNSDKLTLLETALTNNKLLLDTVSGERDGAKAELDKTRLELTNTRHDLEKRLTDIQGILDNLKGDYDQMQRNYDEAKEARAQIEKAFKERVDTLEKQLAETESKLTSTRERLAKLETEYETTRTERDGLKQKNVQLEAEQARLNQRVSELETERDGLQMQVNTLRTELDELRSSGQPTKPDNPTEPPHDAALSLPEE